MTITQNASQANLAPLSSSSLANVSMESLWLANFSSSNTRTVYRNVVADFIATMGIDSPDALYSVTQSQVVAFWEALRDRGLSNATVANRLAALSSLYGQEASE